MMTILLFAICITGQSQKNYLKTDSTLAIPKLTFDANGELKITVSTSSSQHDFDFLVGKWKMHHRKLNKRLENCKDWSEFESTDENQKILNGIGDIDRLTATFDGEPFEGFTLRLFSRPLKS